MIIKRTWDKRKRNKYVNYTLYRWTGWFLFGIIPIYLVRDTLNDNTI